MELFMPTGEKTEKAGTLLTDVLQPRMKNDLKMVEQVDGKLDLLLAAENAETEG